MACGQGLILLVPISALLCFNTTYVQYVIWQIAIISYFYTCKIVIENNQEQNQHQCMCRLIISNLILIVMILAPLQIEETALLLDTHRDTVTYT